MSDLGIGLVGAGYWGSKLARNVVENPDSRLRMVCDLDWARLDAVHSRYNGVRVVACIDDLLAAEEIEAVIIATPAAAHAVQVSAALRAGKHVLVEKPLALSTRECEELAELADASGLTLMIGHTFLYAEPVRALRRLVSSGALGEVLYIYGQRLNLGVIRDDLNALWNFGPHDVSVMQYVLGERAIRVGARQFPLLNREIEDIAFVTVEFESGAVGHIHESWLDPRKVRQLTVVGAKKMALYDDTDSESPLKVYDKGVGVADERPGFTRSDQAGENYGEFRFELRAGDMVAPKIDPKEPLKVEIEHFVECVRSGTRPLTDATHATHVVSVLEAATASAAAGGQLVEVAPPREPRDLAPASTAGEKLVT